MPTGTTSLNAEQRAARSKLAGEQTAKDNKALARAWLDDQIRAGRISAEVDLEVLATVARILRPSYKMSMRMAILDHAVKEGEKAVSP